MKIKNVGMIGRGAVGTLFGNLLNQYLGKDHFCFIASKERCKQYQTTPFYCNGKQCDFNYVSSMNTDKKLDLVIIVVKYPSLKEALSLVESFIDEHTIVLSLLNGINSEQIVEETLQKGIVLHSIAQLMDAVKDNNEVSFTKLGEIVIGTNDEKKKESLIMLAAFFDQAGIPYHIANDIIHEQWNKLVLNCAINQICAVYDVPYRDCQSGGKLHELFIDVMKETASVAAYENVMITDEEIDQWVKALDSLAADSMPSMRQDRLAKRYSEVDLFAKTIIQLSEKYQIDVPLNRDLYDKIKAIEATY